MGNTGFLLACCWQPCLFTASAEDLFSQEVESRFVSTSRKQTEGKSFNVSPGDRELEYPGVLQSTTGCSLSVGGAYFLSPVNHSISLANRGHLWAHVRKRVRIALSSECVTLPRDAAGAAVRSDLIYAPLGGGEKKTHTRYLVRSFLTISDTSEPSRLNFSTLFPCVGLQYVYE